MVLNQKIIIPYDNKQQKFKADDLSYLETGDDQKIILNQLFERLSRNQSYPLLQSGRLYKIYIIVVLLFFVLSIIFMGLMISANSKKEAGHKNSHTPDHDPLEDKSEPIEGPVLDKPTEDNNTKTGTQDDSTDDNTKDGDPIVGKPSRTVKSPPDDEHKKVVFIIIFLITFVTFLVFLLLLMRLIRDKRQLYNALEKHELDLLGTYSDKLGKEFRIQRIHQRKTVFKIQKHFHVYSFCFELRIMNESEKLGLIKEEDSIEKEDYYTDKGSKSHDYRLYEVDEEDSENDGSRFSVSNDKIMFEFPSHNDSRIRAWSEDRSAALRPTLLRLRGRERDWGTDPTRASGWPILPYPGRSSPCSSPRSAFASGSSYGNGVEIRPDS